MIGAGNVATRLAPAFKEAGRSVVQVYSRTADSAGKLAKILDTGFTTNLKELKQDADLYLIAVSDDAIGEIARNLEIMHKMLVHTSGSVPMEVLRTASNQTGVFYPLQTFSRERKTNLSQVPICVEAGSDEILAKLKLLASGISDKVVEVDSDQRKMLHLAAVFACNFPNFMYQIADQITRSANLEFSLLKPLIIETASKVQSMSPENAQTGPALRRDKKIMEQHLEVLENYPVIREIYKIISSEIEKSGSIE